MSQSDQVLRTGVLFKKGSGTGPFGRRNWKPRYFVLTPSKLRYYTFEDGDLKGEVDLSGCDEGMVEVMPMDSMKTGSSASTIWRIAVNAPERRLLVAAGTEMEMNDWVDKLMMAFRVNHGQPMHLPSRQSLSQGPLSSSGASNSGGGYAGDGTGSGVAITDFHNFTVARRPGHGSRQSTGSFADMAHRQSESFQHSEALAAVPPRKQSARRDDPGPTPVRQLQEMETNELRREEEARERAYQVEQTRRFEEAKRAEAEAEAEAVRNQQAEEAQRYHETALRQQQQEEAEADEAEQQRVALQMQLLAVERERDEEQKRSQEALLDEQRRLKREKHERERAAREQQIREQEQRAAATARLDSGEEYDLDTSSSDEALENDTDDTTVEAAAGAAAAPRSSLIGDVKREAMLKQQAAHQRRREASLKEEQRRQREVEVPPRVVEVTRRVPPPGASSVAPVNRASAPKVDSFEL